MGAQLWMPLDGLVQPPRQFKNNVNKLGAETLIKLKFTPSPADSCLFSQRNGADIIMLSIYVDDVFIIGRKEAILQILKDIPEHNFMITVASTPDDDSDDDSDDGTLPPNLISGYESSDDSDDEDDTPKTTRRSTSRSGPSDITWKRSPASLMVSTAKENKEGFTKRQFDSATAARAFYHVVS
jgi:hypothetical protein